MRTKALPFDGIPLNTDEIPQHCLDIESRTRTNLFPWRGQFSPELIDVLLSHYSTARDTVLDPFAGVGTTLFEAARKGLAAIGTEINPAAIAMAETVAFLPLDLKDRQSLLAKAQRILEEAFDVPLPLWSGSIDSVDTVSGEVLADLVIANRECKYIGNILTNVLIRVLEARDQNSSAVQRGFKQHASLVKELPVSNQRCEVFNGDARHIPVRASSIDLIITSPPYINVFNYHQNNRRAMELLGWDLLDVAKSEVGSNRKNRGNRFLTVIQYCIDMLAALQEMQRVLKGSGRVIIIVGRQSSVRGIQFRNGELVSRLAAHAGLDFKLRQERKFTNKFGDLIYEDILHFERSQDFAENGFAARSIACEILKQALTTVHDQEVHDDIRNALELAETVKPSPCFSAASPNSNKRRSRSDPSRLRQQAAQ